MVQLRWKPQGQGQQTEAGRDRHAKAGAHAKGILGYLHEQSGQLVTLRDVHNMIQGFKKEQRVHDVFGKTEEIPNLRKAVDFFKKYNPA
ncbi:hypothetical protein PPTG_22225 [Phytophthora nicotianae INRA-310]|uniref:Uncharacterized protein n=1 Tax=Phytophthora nicotianae (strain INRA-310) TaxID=761204 RepID=W2QP95_PHYN3|nr:hypothetical protein PPTG_22225 [Phytophthora nicotianae INRA-310]ETN14314.1 hypothetical protein PPTG_22225 [Phytophthora nicotianae INRA-310]